LVLLWSLILFLGIPAGGEEDAEEKSSDILEVMAWCKGLREGMDWNGMIRLAKTGCFENQEEDGLLRVRCADEALALIVDAAHTIIDASADQTFACANGVAFVLAVALVYKREELSSMNAMRAQAMLWTAVQENFMIDASI
jgi:hypothetical protein